MKEPGAYGDAGVAVTNQAEIVEQVRLLRNYGRWRCYLYEQIGFGERPGCVAGRDSGREAAALDDWIEARNRLAARLMSLLADLELELPQVAEEARHACTCTVRTLRRYGVEMSNTCTNTDRRGRTTPSRCTCSRPMPSWAIVQGRSAHDRDRRGYMPKPAALSSEMTEEQQDCAGTVHRRVCGQPERAWHERLGCIPHDQREMCRRAMRKGLLRMVARFLCCFRGAGCWGEVLVVDDGSADGTRRELTVLAESVTST